MSNAVPTSFVQPNNHMDWSLLTSVYFQAHRLLLSCYMLHIKSLQFIDHYFLIQATSTHEQAGSDSTVRYIESCNILISKIWNSFQILSLMYEQVHNYSTIQTFFWTASRPCVATQTLPMIKASITHIQ